MPWLPVIAAIAGLAGTGISVGETLANSGGSKPPTPTNPAATPPDAQAQRNLDARVAQQDPNLQASGSGDLSPGYRSIIDQILAGTLGQPGSTAAGNFATGTGQTLNQNFTPANSQPTNAAVQGNPIQLSDFLNTSTQP